MMLSAAIRWGFWHCHMRKYTKILRQSPFVQLASSHASGTLGQRSECNFWSNQHSWRTYMGWLLLYLQVYLHPNNRDAKFFYASKPCHVGMQWIALAKLSDEYPCARISVIFKVFWLHFLLTKLATSSISVSVGIFHQGALTSGVLAAASAARSSSFSMLRSKMAACFPSRDSSSSVILSAAWWSSFRGTDTLALAPASLSYTPQTCNKPLVTRHTAAKTTHKTSYRKFSEI